MLPVATPPNAIVFSSGLVSIPHMARAGFLLNIVAIAVLAMAALWLSPVVFGR
jgi:sodium-dependent dicarboxylate transporter 2/3/5